MNYWRKSHRQAILKHYKFIWTTIHLGNCLCVHRQLLPPTRHHFSKIPYLSLLPLRPLHQMTLLSVSMRQKESIGQEVTQHPSSSLTVLSMTVPVNGLFAPTTLNQRSSANYQSFHFASCLQVLPQSPGFINYLFSLAYFVSSSLLTLFHQYLNILSPTLKNVL